MGTSLTAFKIKDTYSQLLHIDAGPEATAKPVYSGTGTATALSVGTQNASVGNLQLDGNVISALDTDGNITLTPNGAGAVAIAKAAVTGGSVLATTGLGYTAGAGGAVTQATNKTTGVTLNALCGDITMAAEAMSAAGLKSFTLTNNKIAVTDTVVTSIVSGATADTYIVFVTAIAAGSCRVQVFNAGAGTPNEQIVIRFVVVKAANT